MASLSIFGERLRAWRKQRGLSQLDLAAIAGTTPRYVSFIETGRSRPGQSVVFRLAAALNLPLRERNALQIAAGLPPVYNECGLDDDVMAPIRRVIDLVFRNHEPYPAWSFGPALRFLSSNRAAERIFPGMTNMSPETLIDMWCTPTPGASLEETQRSIHEVLAFLRSELFHHPHPDLPALLRRAESHAVDTGPPASLSPPVTFTTLVIVDQHIRTISTIMRFDKTPEVTTSELRVELVFPADDESDAFFQSLAD